MADMGPIDIKDVVLALSVGLLLRAYANGESGATPEHKLRMR